jgi:hypothetical protein
MKTQSVFLDPFASKKEAAEYDRMWAALAARWGDTGQLNEECGEVWQYMGTCFDRNLWVHTFRHRMHPITKRREYWNTPASREYVETLWKHVAHFPKV